MTNFARKLAYSIAVACLALAVGSSPALAKTHHKHHARSHHTTHHAKASQGSSIIRIAQAHLIALGYYDGRVDGVMGPQTRAAIKKFQREHRLKADGVLGSRTNRALAEADHRSIASYNGFGTHESVTSSDAADVVSQDYQQPIGGGAKTIASRFATVTVHETGTGPAKRYEVGLGGSPILIADGQPSVIGVSPVYDLGNEDAIVLTTFSPNAVGCIYRTHILALNGQGSRLLDVENCTRNYTAQVVNGSLYLSFPEHDDNRAVGASWRLEGSTLEKL